MHPELRFYIVVIGYESTWLWQEDTLPHGQIEPADSICAASKGVGVEHYASLANRRGGWIGESLRWGRVEGPPVDRIPRAGGGPLPTPQFTQSRIVKRQSQILGE